MLPTTCPGSPWMNPRKHRERRAAGLALRVAALLTMAGCASSPGGQGGDSRDLELYNGDWYFDAEASRRSQFHYWPRDPITDDVPPQWVQDELFEAVEHWPARFALELTDSLFRVVAHPVEFSFDLPLDESWVETGETRIKFNWRQKKPLVERSFPSNGWLRDLYELTDEGMIVITRQMGFGTHEAEGWLRFAYRRQPG